MTGRLNRPAAADGVIAYQDDTDPNLFHYFPSRIDSVLGETLKTFKVDYWGVNQKPYWVDLGNGVYQSSVGGNLSGSAVPDITKAQRASITKTIEEAYAVKKPNLVPLTLTETTVQPIFAQHVVNMGAGGSVTFPDKVTIGGALGYQVGSGNSLFASLVGAQRENPSASPDFAVNIYAQTKLYADPWRAEIRADLNRVWDYTRSKVNVGLNVGWFDLGVNVDEITQGLINEGIVTITYKEGNGGSEFGYQMLNTTKVLFEAINKQVVSGEGMFRFEPNPTPQQPKENDKWGAGLLPFTMSVNVGYNREHFKQTITFHETISFQGLLSVPLTSSMALAVPCGPDTQSSFFDVQTLRSECVTTAKSKGLQERISKEAAAKRERINLYWSYVESGRWTPKEYSEMLQLLNQITLTENAVVRGRRADGTHVVDKATSKEVDDLLARWEDAVSSGAITAYSQLFLGPDAGDLAPVEHVYIYPDNAVPPAPGAPLLANVNGQMVANLFTIPAANNAAGLVPGQHYQMTIAPMTAKNPGTRVRCEQVAPANYVFIVV